jgi:hypothetical protein
MGQQQASVSGFSIARRHLARGGASSLHDMQRYGLIVRVELPVRQTRQSAA